MEYVPYILILISDSNAEFLDYLKNNYDYSEERFNDVTGKFHIGLGMNDAEIHLYSGTVSKYDKKDFICISSKEEYELIKLYANLGLQPTTDKIKEFLTEMGYANHN
jgi:hypothetical protein